MKNKKTIYNSDEFRKTVQCLTEKIREADELESVDVDKSFQDVMKRVGREKKVPHRRHIYRWSLSIAAAIALALVMNWWSTNVDEGTELDIALLNDTTSICGDEVILITDNQAMNLKNDKYCLKGKKACLRCASLLRVANGAAAVRIPGWSPVPSP